MRRRLGTLAIVSCLAAACASFGSSADDDVVDGAAAPVDAGSETPAIDSPPPPVPPPVPPPPVLLDGSAKGHRVFVTAAIFPANTSLGGFDKACTTAGAKVAPGTTWNAWVSTSMVGALDHVGHSGPWVVATTGDLIASDETQLTSSSLKHAIDRSETGGTITGQAVFTGTLPNGTWSNTSCDDWTSGDASANGMLGIAGNTNGTWTTAGATPCGVLARIYCFEQ
jgi:hypothetical protein